MPTPRKGESKKKFVSRCMGDDEARSDFPDRDQRFAVCNSIFERSTKKSQAEFDLAKAVCCELSKQDIPEVQAVIRLLSRPVAEELRRIATLVEENVEERLDDLAEREVGTPDVAPLSEVSEEGRDDLLAALIASLFLLVTAQVQAPFSPRLRALLGRGVDSLLADGAASLGLGLTGPRLTLLRQAAILELEILLRGSALVSRGDEIRAALETALTSAQARRTLTPLEIAGLGPRAAGEPPRSRQETLADIRRGISGEPTGEGPLPVSPGTRVGTTIDGWAYRWFSIGAFASGLQEPGLAFFRAVNNPPRGPDARTTAFCVWVHERIIPVGRARGQMDRHVELALSGDFEGLMANWPFLRGGAERRGADDEFASFFRTAGLPPFHHGCRTVPQMVRLSDLA